VTVPAAQPLELDVGESIGLVSALYLPPADGGPVLVLAHGAGAGMRHPFLAHIAERLGERGIGTLRYQFPYMEAKAKRPDPPAIAEAAVRAAVAAAGRLAPASALLAGGKSFGGRMTSNAQAKQPLPRVRGLVFLGFPLHPPGQPGIQRAEHLDAVQIPMLFLQGSRDQFARLDLLQPVLQRLGARSTLRLVEDGDHSFKVPKRTGQTDADVLNGLVEGIVVWWGEIA